MAKIRKNKIRWKASADPQVVGYKLYWSAESQVGYDSDFAEVGSVTEVILPDDVLAFPLASGNIQLGVTAFNETGNESDMTKFSGYFDFKAPSSPSGLTVELTEEYHMA